MAITIITNAPKSPVPDGMDEMLQEYLTQAEMPSGEYTFFLKAKAKGSPHMHGVKNVRVTSIHKTTRIGLRAQPGDNNTCFIILMTLPEGLDVAEQFAKLHAFKATVKKPRENKLTKNNFRNLRKLIELTHGGLFSSITQAMTRALDKKGSSKDLRRLVNKVAENDTHLHHVDDGFAPAPLFVITYFGSNEKAVNLDVATTTAGTLLHVFDDTQVALFLSLSEAVVATHDYKQAVKISFEGIKDPKKKKTFLITLVEYGIIAPLATQRISTANLYWQLFAENHTKVKIKLEELMNTMTTVVRPSSTTCQTIDVDYVDPETKILINMSPTDRFIDLIKRAKWRARGTDTPYLESIYGKGKIGKVYGLSSNTFTHVINRSIREDGFAIRNSSRVYPTPKGIGMAFVELAVLVDATDKTVSLAVELSTDMSADERFVIEELYEYADPSTFRINFNNTLLTENVTKDNLIEKLQRANIITFVGANEHVYGGKIWKINHRLFDEVLPVFMALDLATRSGMEWKLAEVEKKKPEPTRKSVSSTTKPANGRAEKRKKAMRAKYLNLCKAGNAHTLVLKTSLLNDLANIMQDGATIYTYFGYKRMKGFRGAIDFDLQYEWFTLVPPSGGIKASTLVWSDAFLKEAHPDGFSTSDKTPVFSEAKVVDTPKKNVTTEVEVNKPKTVKKQNSKDLRREELLILVKLLCKHSGKKEFVMKSSFLNECADKMEHGKQIFEIFGYKNFKTFRSVMHQNLKHGWYTYPNTGEGRKPITLVWSDAIFNEVFPNGLPSEENQETPVTIEAEVVDVVEVSKPAMVVETPAATPTAEPSDEMTDIEAVRSEIDICQGAIDRLTTQSDENAQNLQAAVAEKERLTAQLETCEGNISLLSDTHEVMASELKRLEERKAQLDGRFTRLKKAAEAEELQAIADGLLQQGLTPEQIALIAQLANNNN